ncbi:hypothetical protein ACLMJK_004850 [Lecanora helva]
MGSLTSLAEEILANARQLDQYLSHQQSESPSFDNDVLTALPPKIESIRNALVNSAQALKKLSQGPSGRILEASYSVRHHLLYLLILIDDAYLQWTDILSLRMIYEFKIPQAVPLEGSIAYSKIASMCGLPEHYLRRYMRHAMGNHLFAEVSPTVVRHTASSRKMATDPDFFDLIGLQLVEFAPVANRAGEALKQYGDSSEPNQTAWNLVNETALPFYEFVAQHPERARRFGAGMRFLARGKSSDLEYLVSAFNWNAIDHAGATVVDVGGGVGSVSQFLARSTKHITFIVQDLPGTIEQGRASLPSEFQGRVNFVAQDFFQKQSLESPDVYLFRWIMHNWRDSYCIQIFRALIPAIRPSTRIIVFDYTLPETPETQLTKKLGQDVDMIMASCYNGVERTKADWHQLIKNADKRFELENISQPEDSTMSVIEIRWSAA